MQREGANKQDMQVSDFICDFSLKAWDGAFPLVEGHQGSLISGDCLTLAWTEVVINESSSAPESYTCTMCLEETDRPGWASPVNEGASICKKCIKLGAGRLHQDPDWAWERPKAPDGK